MNWSRYILFPMKYMLKILFLLVSMCIWTSYKYIKITFPYKTELFWISLVHGRKSTLHGACLDLAQSRAPSSTWLVLSRTQLYPVFILSLIGWFSSFSPLPENNNKWMVLNLVFFPTENLSTNIILPTKYKFLQTTR